MQHPPMAMMLMSQCGYDAHNVVLAPFKTVPPVQSRVPQEYALFGVLDLCFFGLVF